MKNIFVFNQTVIGSMHISRNIPCEDSSLSFSSEDKKYKIAIVADGHGSSACFRSAFGSKTAVDVAFECFKEFADSIFEDEEKEKEFYDNFLNDVRYQEELIKRITDTIVSKWHGRVVEHYNNNPVKPDELKENKDISVYEKNIPHIYGTTLIAALLFPECLILIHQGDGRCNLFYADGTVDQPVPWDSRCEFNTTTSMCDRDVATSIRHCVIDLNKKKVVACILGSDGIEDAYSDTWESIGNSHNLMGGVYTFCKYLLCQIEEVGEEQFKKDLKEMLPDFSENGMFSNCGSGDDVSVAGIVDVDEIELLVSSFQKDINLYELEDKLIYQKGLLGSKERKHGILNRRVNDAQNEIDSVKTKIDSAQQEICNLEKEKADLQMELENEKRKLMKLKNDASQINENKISIELRAGVDLLLSALGMTEDESKKKATFNIQRQESLCSEKEKKLSEIDKLLEEQKNKFEILQSQLKAAEEKRDKAKTEFDEYDVEYQEIQSRIDDIKNQIAKLG